MERKLKTLLLIVVGVWVTALGIIAVGNMLGLKPQRAATTETYPTEYYVPVTQPSTEIVTSTDRIQIDMVTDFAPSTELSTESSPLEIPTGNGNMTTYKSDTVKTLAVPQGNKEIGEALVKAVNMTKATKGFTATTNEKADFVIDSVTGGNAVRGIVEDLINKAGNKPQATYSFSNGVDQNGSSETPNSVIPPMNNTASLDESAIKSASAVQNADGGYDITLTLNDESQSLSQKAVNHSALFNPPDKASLSFPSGFKLGELNFYYTSATINASVNSEGKLTSISYSLPIAQGNASGTMIAVPVNVSLHGTYTANVTVTY